MLVGTGDARQYKPARVEVTGSLEGWDVSVKRVGEASQEIQTGPTASIITLHRAKGPLIFDLGICLVLFSPACLGIGSGHSGCAGQAEIRAAFRNLVRRVCFSPSSRYVISFPARRRRVRGSTRLW